MDDLDDLLARGDRFGDSLPGGLFLHGGDKIAGDGQGYIRFEQRHPHLAQRGGHIGIRQRTLFGQPVKDRTKAFREVFKHALRLLSWRDDPQIGGAVKNATTPTGATHWWERLDSVALV